VHGSDGIVSTWIGTKGCDIAGMKMLPHDDKWEYKRNVQGMVDFEKGGGTRNMVGQEGGLVQWKDEKYFQSFAVCMAREEQHFTPKDREDHPLLMFWQRNQSNKLGHRCALIDLELIDL
jgi:hypothetical protein